MAAAESLQDLHSSSIEVPKVMAFPKPLIAPRPALGRPIPSNHRVTPFTSPALDLTELKKTQKRVRFLLEKETCKSPVSFTMLARPTYHGKCFLCRNNIGDPHTHYNHPVFKTTDQANKTSSDPQVERRKSIVIPSEWKRLKERKKLQGFWERRSDETEEERYFIPVFPNNSMSNRKNKFRNISLSQNQKSKNKEDAVGKNVRLSGPGGSELYLKAGTISNREASLSDDTDRKRETDALSNSQNGTFKDQEGTASEENTNRKSSHQHEKTYLVPEARRRTSLGKWCECDNSMLPECWECGLGSGHEKWCRFRTGECPDCGKPIKGKHRVIFRPRRFRTLSSSSLDSDETYEKKKSSERSEKYPNSERYRSHSRIEQFNEPNPHRQAYLLALADARIQRWREDPWSFTNPSTGGYFSYFPSLKTPRNTSTSEVKDVPCLGVRGHVDKVKVKDPMKHVLGSVKLGDYYPNGKKFPKGN